MSARFNLKVPYADKDEAKRLGARWDGIQKCWYVEGRTLTPFMKWLDPNDPALRHMSKADTSKAEPSATVSQRMKGVVARKVA